MVFGGLPGRQLGERRMALSDGWWTATVVWPVQYHAIRAYLAHHTQLHLEFQPFIPCIRCPQGRKCQQCNMFLNHQVVWVYQPHFWEWEIGSIVLLQFFWSLGANPHHLYHRTLHPAYVVQIRCLRQAKPNSVQEDLLRSPNLRRPNICEFMTGLLVIKVQKNKTWFVFDTQVSHRSFINFWICFILFAPLSQMLTDLQQSMRAETQINRMFCCIHHYNICQLWLHSIKHVWISVWTFPPCQQWC